MMKGRAALRCAAGGLSARNARNWVTAPEASFSASNIDPRYSRDANAPGSRDDSALLLGLRLAEDGAVLGLDARLELEPA